MLENGKKKILSFLTGLCREREAVLISPTDLIKNLSAEELSENDLEKKVIELSNDGYFDLVYSDRRGETVYCISLTEKGKGYLRDVRLLRRTVVFRLCLTVSLAILSFIIGLVLKAIFKR